MVLVLVKPQLLEGRVDGVLVFKHFGLGCAQSFLITATTRRRDGSFGCAKCAT